MIVFVSQVPIPGMMTSFKQYYDLMGFQPALSKRQGDKIGDEDGKYFRI